MARVQRRADLAQRPPQVAVGLAADERAALVWPVQAKNHAHGGGLAGTVQTEEARDGAGTDVESEPVNREVTPEAFREASHLDVVHGHHARDRIAVAAGG